MSGLGDGQSDIDTLRQLRELSPSGDAIEGGFVAAEARALEGLRETRADVQQRRQTEWRDGDEAREAIANMAPEKQRTQFETARDQLCQDLSRVFIAYNEMALLGAGPVTLLDAIEDLLVALHNPVLRESLLIPVASAYEDDVRDLFAEFAAIMWGFVETTGGEQGAHYRTFLGYLAEHWGMSLDELERSIFQGEQPPV